MDAIFINSENSRTSEYHILLLNLTNKIDLRSEKTVALSNLSIYYTWKNIKSSYNNNKFKISAPTWREEFNLPDGSYSIPDIQNYFKYILKKHGENVDNPSIMIYINKIENRITFKIKSGYYLELLTPETMKLLGSTVSKINKDKNGGNVPNLEVVEVVLVHCNLVNNDYQQNSRILFTFVPNKTFGSLLEISLANHVFLKTFNSEFREIKVWLTDQKSRPLEVEDKINVTLIIKLYIKMRYSIEPRKRIYVKGYGFMSFARNFSDKYSKSLIDKGIDISKTFAKTAGKRTLKKSAEATDDLIGNKIPDKITAKPIKNDVNNERYVSPEERQEIINKLRLA